MINLFHYGLDIGGTKIEIAIFNDKFECVQRLRTPTPTDNYAEFINSLGDLVSQADHYCNSRGSVGIGIACTLNSEGLAQSVNINCLNGRHLICDLTNKLNRPVTIDNDSNLFTLSEANGGAADNANVVFGVIIGTGLGGALSIGQKIVPSAQGLSGEIGHTCISANLHAKYQLPLHQCACGLKGCYESYLAGSGLSRLYQHFGAQQTDTKSFAQALKAKHPIALTTFDCYIDIAGAAFANLVLHYDPEVIVLGGGLSNIPEISASLPEAMANHLFNHVAVPPVTTAKFGDSSGVRGAAIIGAQHAANIT